MKQMAEEEEEISESTAPAVSVDTEPKAPQKGKLATKILGASNCTVIEEMHWIGSMFNVGAMLAMFPIGYALDCAGCKIIMLIVATLVSGCFLVLAFVFKMAAWIAARILLGEIAEPRVREALGTFYQLFLVIGIVFEYCLGETYDVRILGAVSAKFPIIFLLCSCLYPSHQSFSMLRDKTESAKKSLQWYRGKNYDITEEFKALEDTILV
ncbi:hypothetical protein C0J52_01757 [Blattella germanica]|nr:hypothetical protein C0J52_01757 [Blattella germanica]